MRFGPKKYLAAATIPGNAYTYPAAFNSQSGWKGAVGVLVKVFQDYNGVGDRTLSNALAYPFVHDNTTHNYAAAGLAPSAAMRTAVPFKADLVATFTTILNSTNGSRIITRSSGSFITDGVVAGHIVSMPLATNIPFGSVVESVDSATQITLDRAATATASNFTGHASKVPLVVDVARIVFAGTNPLPLYWPADGICLGLQSPNTATTNLTGVIMEAWPIFDINVLENVPDRYNLAGVTN